MVDVKIGYEQPTALVGCVLGCSLSTIEPLYKQASVWEAAWCVEQLSSNCGPVVEQPAHLCAL